MLVENSPIIFMMCVKYYLVCAVICSSTVVTLNVLVLQVGCTANMLHVRISVFKHFDPFRACMIDNYCLKSIVLITIL